MSTIPTNIKPNSYAQAADRGAKETVSDAELSLILQGKKGRILKITSQDTPPPPPLTFPPPIPVLKKEEFEFSIVDSQKPLLSSGSRDSSSTSKTALISSSALIPTEKPKNPSLSKFPLRWDKYPDFDGECSKLQTFLSTEISRLKSSSDAGLIYVCIGHGGLSEQLWPGFVLERLQNGKTVHSLLFERGDHLIHSQAYEKLKEAYENYPDANSQLNEYFDKCFSVDQFQCGMPEINRRTYEDLLPFERTRASKCPYSAYWKTHKQIQEVHENFQRYIEALLVQGTQIVLSDHTGPIKPSDPVVRIYNTLLKKYPHQLHFLWGHEGTNVITNQLIETEAAVKVENGKDNAPKATGTIWTHYPRESGGLYRCKFS